MLVSPHTGLAFAALAVGTPWLAISGGRWTEFFETGVPFYSVLPDPRRYPAFGPGFDALAADGKIVSMSRQRISDDLARIVEAAEILIERRVDVSTLPRPLPALAGEAVRKAPVTDSAAKAPDRPWIR